MSENPQSIWTRPWSGPAKHLAWFLLLVSVSFVAIWCVEFATQPGPEAALKSLLIALVVSLLAGALLLGVRWLCSWDHFRRFLFALACMATLVALVYAEENVRGKYLWQKHQREWEAKGEKFDIMALAPAQVPDEKNFAMTPLLKPALDLSQGPAGVVWHNTNGTARLEKINAEIATQGGTNHLVLGSLEKGTFGDLSACAEFYRGNANYPQAPSSATAAETILTALGKFEPELKELREAAIARPDCRFPIHYEYPNCWAILLPHLARLKILTTLVLGRAIAELEAGQITNALEDLKLGFRFSDSIRGEPILIDHLVRLATLGIDLQTIREGLVRHAWSQEQLKELADYLGALNLLAEYKLAMRGERALSVGGINYLRRQGSLANPLAFIDDGRSSDFVGLLSLAPGGWFYQNMLTISRLHQDYLLPAVDEQTHRVSPSLVEAEERAVEQLRSGPYAIFAKLLLPALGKAAQRSARMQTYVDCSRIACAIERYRLVTSNLPETLEALCPRFLNSIPKDIIDGKPLRYHPDSSGDYLLYSVGWNQTDEGGQLAWLRERKRDRMDLSWEQEGVDPARGDWVWQMAYK